MTEPSDLKKAIALLEAQRAILGDAVVDSAIEPLRQQLTAQEHREQEAGTSIHVGRKLITILFADVVGSTAMAERLGGETTRLILERSLRILSQAVEEFGGTVTSLMGDGLMALFGVPQAYENDAERSVMAAFHMHQKMAAYAQELDQSLEVRVGINTGRAVLGEENREGNLEITAMGQPPVNLTARLQSAARPGSILLGESTARMVRYRFQVEPRDPLVLKGFADPVETYEVLGELAQPAPAGGIAGVQSVLVGRDVELQKLAAVVAGLEQGIGGIAALIGEPGIGKSRLLQEIKEREWHGRPRFAEGRAYSHTQDQPFSIILDLLAELLGLVTGDSPAILDLKLEAALAPLFESELELVWPFLASLLGAPVPPQYATALSGLDPEALNARIIQAVQLLVRRIAAQRPLVLSFEDLHWADGGSFKLIESLLTDTEHSPLMLILLFRPDRDKPAWQLKVKAETHFAHRYLELPLSPLNEAASGQLILNILEATDLPGDLKAAIGEKAQGNPLYVEEIIRSLVEGGYLERDGQSWRMREPVGRLNIPETVEKVIQARLDRLPRAERATLQAASVIGRRFPYRVLEGLVQANGNLRDQLVRLQQAGLVRERSRLPEPEYIFKHVIVQEVSYNTLLTEQRRQLHRKAAETLEQLYPDRREELAGSLAQHYAAAGEKDRAIPLFVQAAERAEKVYAYEEALHFLLNAWELSQQGEGEARVQEQRMLLERLGDMRYLLIDRLEAYRHYRQALDSLPDQHDGDKWATIRLTRKLCEAWWVLPNVDEIRLEAEVQTRLKRALKLVKGEEPHLETVSLLTIAAKCIREPSWHDTFKYWPVSTAYAQEAIEMAGQLDAPVELSAALDNLSRSYNREGRIRDHLAIEQQRQRLSRDPRFNDLREQLNILISTAIALKMAGDYAQAMPMLLEAETLGERIRDPFGQSESLTYQAECWVRLDQWDQVLIVEERVNALRRRYPGKLRPLCWMMSFSAFVHALRGDEEKARRLAGESYEIMLGTVYEDASAGEENWNGSHHY